MKYLQEVISHGWKQVVLAMVFAATSLSAATITVNSSGNTAVADSEITLLEALQTAQPGDTIAFNIPDPGPHYIKIPVGGFPLITIPNLTIDGYTQPGSQANTNGILAANNAKLQIVIDAREQQPASQLSASGNVIPGFEADSYVFAVIDVPGFQLRGVSILTHHSRSGGTPEDPNVAAIAALGAARDMKVQGCWIGLDPDGRSVYGGAGGVLISPVAPVSFIPGVVIPLKGGPYTPVEFQQTGPDAGNLVFGTDGDGTGDRGEFNIVIGHNISLILSSTDTRVKGNFINVFPDGVTFYSGGSDPLSGGEYQSVLESAKADGLVFGTDGDGVSDDLERNICAMAGPYDAYVEIYRTSRPFVIAGNYFGVGVDGLSSPQIHAPLVNMRNNTNIRIGSNMDGTSDDLESNFLMSIPAPMIAYHGDNLAAPTGGSLIDFRRNRTKSCHGAIPVTERPDHYYFTVLADPANNYRATINPASTRQRLQGTIPAAKDALVTRSVDLYLVDPSSMAEGSIVGGKWLKTITPADDNSFDVDISTMSFPTNHRYSLTVAATYSRTAEDLSIVSATTPFSDPLNLGENSELRLLPLTILPGNEVRVSWTGSAPPYFVETEDELGTGWVTLFSNLEESSVTVPKGSGASKYFRIRGQQ